MLQQDYANCEFLLLDQEEKNWSASKFIKENLPEIAADPRVKIDQGKNLWHSGGHNKLMKKALNGGAGFYICASNDMLYPTDLVSKVVAAFTKEENQKFGSATVKLRQWDFENQTTTNLLDSCGIGITRSHHFFDRGQGEEDHGQFDNKREIFGASGALAIFRIKALEEAAIDKKVFDERLHYKNDVDLAYRLQLLGWKSLFFPEVVVYHDRQLGGSKSWIGLFRSRAKTQKWMRENSAFGQLLVIAKNFCNDFSWQVRFLTKLRIAAMKLYAFLFEKSVRNGFRKFEKIRGELEKSPRKVEASEIEKLMS